MMPLLPGTLIIDFYAKPSSAKAWPLSWSANFDGSLADAKTVAQGTLNAHTFPLAVRYEILDHQGTKLFDSPELVG